MNKKILVTFTSIFALILSITAQRWELSNQIKGTDITPLYSATDGNGNTYAQSQFTGSVTLPGLTVNAYGSSDLLITKIRTNGTIAWVKQIGSTYVDNPSGITIQVTGVDTFIFVTGSFRNTCQFGLNATIDTSITYSPASGIHFDMFLAKYKTDGTLVWAQNLAYGNLIQASSNITTGQYNNLILCGYFRENLTIERGAIDTTITLPLNTWAVFFAKFNADGGLLWLKHYVMTGGSNQTRINSITTTKYGYLFGGNLEVSLTLDVGTITNNNPGAGIFDAFVYKTDLNGTGEFVRKIYGTANDNLTSLTSDKYGNFFVLGNYTSPNLYVDSTNTSYKTITGNIGGFDTYIAKYNRNMILQWVVTKGGTTNTRYNDIDVKNNVIYATGYFSSTLVFNQDTLITSSSSNPDPFFSALDDRANAIMGDEITGIGNYNDAGNTVAIDANMNAHIVGVFRSNTITIGDSTYTNPETGSPDLFYAKYKQPFRVALTNKSNVTCNGNDDGMLTVTPYFGYPPYHYAWSQDLNLDDSIATGLAPGTYTVTVTDAIDSVTYSTYQITEPTIVSIDFTSVNPTNCFESSDGSINITASGGNGGYHYTWASGDGGSNVNPLAEDQSGLSSAWYYITLTDINGCTKDDSAYVNQPTPVSVFANSIIDATFGNLDGAIYITLSGGTAPYTNHWYGPGGFEETSEDITGLIAGPYELIAEDSHSCSIDTVFVVNEVGQLEVTITDTKPVTCKGSADGRVVIQTSCPLSECFFNYHWEDSLENDLGVNLNTLDNVSGGRYYVTVTEIFSGLTGYNMAIVDEAEMEIDPNILSSNPACYGASTGMINLTVTGGKLPYNYLWSRAGETSEDLTNVAASTQYYKVRITDSYGCQAYDSVIIGQPTEITIAFEDSMPTCPGGDDGTITALPTGGSGVYTYKWSDNGDQSDQMAYDLEAGTYFVTVTGQNNCIIIGTHELLNPEPVTIDDIRTYDISCYGLSDGAIKVVTSGAHGIYIYTWGHTSDNVDTLSGLVASTYNVTVADFYGCTQATASNIAITEPPVITIEDAISYDVSCFGLDNGAIQLTVTGGTGGYDFTWNPVNINSDTIFNLAPGAYDVTVTDANDCPPAELSNIVIDEPDALVFDSVQTTNVTIQGGNDGSIRIFASGGTAPYSYKLDNNSYQSVNEFISLAAGRYHIEVTDANTCGPISPADSVEITEPTTGLIDLNNDNFIVYPNPSSNGIFYFEYTPIKPDITIRVYNTMGSKVYEVNCKIMKNSNVGKLDLSGLSKGIYYLIIDNARYKNALIIN